MALALFQQPPGQNDGIARNLVRVSDGIAVRGFDALVDEPEAQVIGFLRDGVEVAKLLQARAKLLRNMAGAQFQERARHVFQRGEEQAEAIFVFFQAEVFQRGLDGVALFAGGFALQDEPGEVAVFVFVGARGVGGQVSQDRSLGTLQAVVDTLPRAARSTSDGHAAYAELVWPEGAEQVVSLGKEETYTIESLNANLRTYLKRLARRSRCFSRSLEALRRAVRLFVYYYNQRQRLYLAHPALRGCLPLLN